VRKGIKLGTNEMANDLEEIFEEQAAEARKDPRMDALYEKARYPLVVLADEIMLQSGWEHADEWQQQILEEKYYKTNVGGDQYFGIAKDLRPEDVELAAIIYAGLALGFGGKYRERPEKLSENKKKVYRLLGEYLGDVGEKLTPEAYNVSPQSAKRLNPVVTLAKVAIVGGIVLVMYYFITFLIWSVSISDLREMVKAIGL
jgi:type IV/VI secretion system ImpK/VasF family protein